MLPTNVSCIVILEIIDLIYKESNNHSQSNASCQHTNSFEKNHYVSQLLIIEWINISIKVHFYALNNNALI